MTMRYYVRHYIRDYIRHYLCTKKRRQDGAEAHRCRVGHGMFGRVDTFPLVLRSVVECLQAT